MGNDEASARLKTFVQVLKFGHDLFDADGLQAAAAVAVTDSRLLLNFRNAVLFELTADKKARLLGQFAQVEPHAHAAAALAQKHLVENLTFDENNSCILTGENGLPAELAGNNAVCFCCKLLPPAGTTGTPFAFVWLLEYEREIPAHVPNLAKLMGKSVAEALTLAKLSGNSSWRASGKVKKLCWTLLLTVLFILALFIPVPESENAEFSLKSSRITAAYAWFDGPLALCLKQDGDTVQKGETIIRYDVAQQQYKYAAAVAALKEAEADLQLELKNSFTDEEKLGKVKLLKARSETLKVAVQEADWYLKHAEITAPESGILVLSDGRAEELAGKAVRTGDKLFEVFGTEGMIAEILVNEQNSSILQKDFSVQLFLHTAPEKAIPAEILEISRYPELTEQKTYCYPVRVQLPGDDVSHLRFGMRGIAKLSGEPVPLGYFLFKNLILYFRNW